MAWSYSKDPSTSPRDEVRFLIGDTDCDHELLQDEEIDFLVTNGSSTILAAAEAAEAIAAIYSRKADTEVDNTKFLLSQRAVAFRALAKSLRARGGAGSASGIHPHPTAPGASMDLTDDIVKTKPTIRRGMTDHPGHITGTS